MHVAPEYEASEAREHLRSLAIAYLEASERLCQDMASGSWTPSFDRGQPVLWLAFHATELFLKACISPVAPKQIENPHSLTELLLAFTSKYPNLPFEPPFGCEPMPADPALMDMALKGDATLHQQLRYPTDRNGQPWRGIRAFTPALFLSSLKRLRSDFDRIGGAVFDAREKAT
jgi:hypothetical protein